MLQPQVKLEAALEAGQIKYQLSVEAWLPLKHPGCVLQPPVLGTWIQHQNCWVDFNNVRAHQQVDISDISQEKYTNLLEATRQKNDHAVEMLRKDMVT